jgi:hypothetical protein
MINIDNIIKIDIGRIPYIFIDNNKIKPMPFIILSIIMML